LKHDCTYEVKSTKPFTPKIIFSKSNLFSTLQSTIFEGKNVVSTTRPCFFSQLQDLYYCKSWKWLIWTVELGKSSTFLELVVTLQKITCSKLTFWMEQGQKWWEVNNFNLYKIWSFLWKCYNYFVIVCFFILPCNWFFFFFLTLKNKNVCFIRTLQ